MVLHFIFYCSRTDITLLQIGRGKGWAFHIRTGLPFSPVGQTANSDHVLTWHCWNEAVGRREHEKPLHVLRCSFFLALRDSEKSPGAAQHLGQVINSEAASEKCMRNMVGYHFLRSLLYLQRIHYCKIHRKAGQDFFWQWFTRGCAWVKPSFSSLWLSFA